MNFSSCVFLEGSSTMNVSGSRFWRQAERQTLSIIVIVVLNRHWTMLSVVWHYWFLEREKRDSIPGSYAAFWRGAQRHFITCRSHLFETGRAAKLHAFYIIVFWERRGQTLIVYICRCFGEDQTGVDVEEKTRKSVRLLYAPCYLRDAHIR